MIFYQQIFRNFTGSLGHSTGWGRYQFYAFFATGLIINALGQMLFMTNIDELTDMIRTGESRLPAVEADRHAIPRLAKADRVVLVGQLF